MAKKPTGRPKWSPAPPAPQNPAPRPHWTPAPAAKTGPPPAAKKQPPKKPAPKKGPVLTPYQQLLNKLKGVPGQERDAFAALSTLFNNYGLSTLAPKILDFLQQGFGSDTITTLLQQTPEYKARFAGNDGRLKLGLQVLTPAEYLSTEASYRQLLQAGGLDPAFMSQKQYAEWISKDISPTEIQSRVNLAVQATTTAPPELLSAFAQIGVAHGDLTSYFLNDKTAMPVLQQKMNQAQIIEAGKLSGLQVDSSRALQFAQQGVSAATAQSAYQKISQMMPEAAKLSSIYSKAPAYTQKEAENETLGNSGEAENIRLGLSQKEQATFTGQGGVGQKSFSQQTAGTGF